MSPSGGKRTDRGFTLVEMLLAVVMVGVLTALAMLTFGAISHGWQISMDYLDKMQRTDYALDQLTSALRSMYYPHNGKQDADYGFVLTNNGDGERPSESDMIEWSKKGGALVGKSAVVDTDHRVQVRMMEEGDRFGKHTIQKTGLYARMCVNPKLKARDETESSDEDHLTFADEEIYEPVLIADGIVGFDCKVLKDDKKVEAENDESLFEEEFSNSNAVPYKVQLTFYLADEDGRSYRTDVAPVIRIVSIPIFEQSQDGASLPGEDDKNKKEDAASGRAPMPGGRK